MQRHIAQRQWDELLQELPKLAYIALAPFTGPEEAISLVEEMSTGAGRPGSSPTAV